MRTKKMNPFLVTLSEKVLENTTYSYQGESFVFVLQGTLEMLLNSQEIALEEGDCIYFDTSLEHRFCSRESTGRVILEVTSSRP